MVAGNNPALISLEPRFGQDLNGSGAVTPSATVEAAGLTDLVQVAGTYFFNPEGGGWGQQLKFGGAIAVASVSQLIGWHAIGAEQVAGGYQVAWKTDVGEQYSVWTTDSNGNYLHNLGGVVPGNHPALLELEPSFGQDLNNDNIIGEPPAVIDLHYL